MLATNKKNTPSFCGITRYLTREIYDNVKAQKRLSNLPNADFVGQIPNEFLNNLIKTHKTPQEKRKAIINLMQGFTKFSDLFNNFKPSPKKTLSLWERIFNFKKPPKTIKRFEVFHSPLELEKIEEISILGAQLLTKTFQDVGLLKKREKITLDYLGKGCSGSVFKLIFPKKTGFKPKILKIFSKSEFERRNSQNFKRFNNGTAIHEMNAMLYIKNALQKTGFKNSQYIEGFFASLKNRFMLVEDVFNYPKQEINPHLKIDYDLNLILWDKSNSGNVLNGRLVDFGYIQNLKKVPFYRKENKEL